eukprot:TRINITY_DN8075_c0_g1_i1.p1 TRINITY_DN8075_c0_g1~~TRINITY_DN8075_c0_g1_i1.p1  ORF type:complete len:90 (-),score=10.04 TRINITY_DN8075_c0_g1_i1:42-311(-)
MSCMVLLRYQSILDKHSDSVIAAFKDVERYSRDQVLQIQMYGELFGGGYPHEDVEPVDGVELIQDEILYCPGLEFYAFDIAVGKNSKKD